MIQKIRISIGSAAVLGFVDIKTDVLPTTCYLMTYTEKMCRGECQFCPQGTSSHSNAAQQLSRINWPEFDWNRFLDQLSLLQKSNKKSKFQRICLQTLNYPGYTDDALFIVREIHKRIPKTPISVAIPPVSKNILMQLQKNGLDRIGIALDACSPSLFEKIKNPSHKGPYRWENHIKAIDEALEVFGKHRVTTHFIVGLGESEEELIKTIDNTIKRNVLPGIFMFTPIPHTPMEHHPRPSIKKFRRIQLARYLLLYEKIPVERFNFSSEGRLESITGFSEVELNRIIEKEIAFYTAGCPGCNRPYYTSRPGKEHDGFPRKLLESEKKKIFSELQDLINTANHLEIGAI
ncbi:MAG: radical SAM protein [Candidatus Lokiarchaeota archaeon]|nr:radical SAM protein [Candidatus Harpocratesius repetitus]